MQCLPRLIVYSYLSTNTIVNVISLLSKKERKLVGNAALVFPGRNLKINLHNQLADKKPCNDDEGDEEDRQMVKMRI